MKNKQAKLLAKKRAIWLPESSEEPSIVLSSRVSFSRNLADKKHNLHKPSEAIKEDVSELNKVILSSDEWMPFMMVDKSAQNIIKILAEKMLIEKKMANASSSPKAIVSKGLNAICILNHIDHFKLQIWHQGAINEKDLKTDSNLISEVDSKLTIAKYDSDSFISNDKSLSGTGLKLESVMHLPAFMALRHDLFLKQASQSLGLNIKPIFTWNHNILGAFFMVSASIAKGDTPEIAMEKNKKVVNMLIKHELGARNLIRKHYASSLLEKISPAFAQIRFMSPKVSYQMAIYSLSLMWLGAELGMFPTIPVQKIQKLIPECATNTLKCSLEDPVDDENLDSARALYIREVLGI